MTTVSANLRILTIFLARKAVSERSRVHVLKRRSNQKELIRVLIFCRAFIFGLIVLILNFSFIITLYLQTFKIYICSVTEDGPNWAEMYSLKLDFIETCEVF